MSNNNYPFWIKKHLDRLNRLNVELTFNEHWFKRRHRNLEKEKCVETVRIGKVVLLKSLWPGKIVFKKYYGKDNETYVVVALFMKHQIEVKTAWKKIGR